MPRPITILLLSCAGLPAQGQGLQFPETTPAAWWQVRHEALLGVRPGGEAAALICARLTGPAPPTASMSTMDLGTFGCGISVIDWPRPLRAVAVTKTPSETWGGGRLC